MAPHMVMVDSKALILLVTRFLESKADINPKFEVFLNLAIGKMIL